MPLSDAQLRQRVDWAIARSENLVDEGVAAIGHLRAIRDELTARLNEPAPEPEPPEPTPEPEPEPEPTPTPGLIFRSTWGTALGRGTSAIRDAAGAAWDDEACMADLMEVIAADAVPGERPPAGIDRVLRCELTSNHTCRNLIAHLQRRGLQRGQPYWLRWYYRVDAPNARQISHYDTIDVFGYRNCAIHTPDCTGGRYRPVLRTESLPYPLIYWQPDGNSGAGPFNRFTWYRLEYHMEILATAERDARPVHHAAWGHPGQLEFRIWPRIYRGHETEPLADAWNFSQQDFGGGNGTMNLGRWYDEGNSILTSAAFYNGPDAMDDFTRVGIGDNGQSNLPPSPSDGTQFKYYADYAVSTDGWIGPVR